MSSVPPPPPPPSQVDVRVDYAAAASKVSLPATLMIVAAALAIFWSLVGLVLNLLGTGFGAMAPGMGDERLVQLLSGGVGVAAALVSLAIYGFIIFGALKMKNLESYNMAMAAAILSMASVCCACPCGILTLAAGIWALVVLLDNNVKAAFRG